MIAARKFGTVVRGLMMDMQKLCPETIVLAVMDQVTQTVTYTDVIESPQLIRYSVSVGATRPLYISAGGQLLLAYQEEKWLDRYLRTIKLKPFTKRTITDVVQLRKKLDLIRKTGLSISISEAIDGATGVAAPIFGIDGAVLAALLIAGPTERHAQDGQKWNRVVKEFAERASRAVGFAGHPGAANAR
jgi:DNA-binding IclR family transcriptional regulator